MPRKTRGRRVLLLLASALPLLATEEDHHQPPQHPHDGDPSWAHKEDAPHDRAINSVVGCLERAAQSPPAKECLDSQCSSSSGPPPLPSSHPLHEKQEGRDCFDHCHDGNCHSVTGGSDEAAIPLHEQLDIVGTDKVLRADSDDPGDEVGVGSDRRCDDRRDPSEGHALPPKDLVDRAASAATMTTTQFSAAIPHRHHQSIHWCPQSAAADSTSCYDPPRLPPWELGFVMSSSCVNEMDVCSWDNPVHHLRQDACSVLNESAARVGRTSSPLSTSSTSCKNTSQSATVPSPLLDSSSPPLLSDDPANVTTVASTETPASNETGATSEIRPDLLTKESAATQDAAPRPSSSAPAAVDERFVNAVDYASKSAGGLVIDKSPNFHGTSNLLTSDRDRYAIVECQEPTKWVVIGLSEDILVKRVGVSMLERYSSHVKEFSLLVSTTGTEAWRELGNFTAAHAPGEQVFDMVVPMWARYVKFQILSHYGQEHYCTVSQIKVHGSTVLQGFHEQWQETDADGVGDAGAAEVAQVDNVSHFGDARLADREAAATSGLLNKEDEGNATAVATPSITRSPGSNLSDEFATARDEALSAEGATVEQLDPSAFPWLQSASVEGSCLRSAAPATTSRQHSDPHSASETSTASLVWKTRRVKLGVSTRTRDAGSVACLASEHPMVARLPRAGISPVPPLTQSPLLRLIQSASSKLGWKINFDGLSPMVRYLSSRKDSPDGSKDETKSVAATGIMPKDLNSSDFDRNHPETPMDKSVRDDVRDPAKDSVPEVEHAAVLGKEGGKVLSNLLERYPSASCLAKLESTVVRVSQMKRGGGGGHGNVAGAHPGSGMEPVFKKLTDEIKALQAGLVAYEEISKESVSCFQEVILDVFADMELQRQLQERRLERLEQDFFFVGWIVALRLHLSYLFSVLLRLFDSFLISGVGAADWRFRLAGLTVLLVVGVSVKALVKRRFRRSTQSPDCSVASSCASAAPDCIIRAEEKTKVVTVVHKALSTPDVSPLK